MKDMDAVILAVAHEPYKALTMEQMDQLFKGKNQKKVLADLKGILDRKVYENAGYLYWRL